MELFTDAREDDCVNCNSSKSIILVDVYNNKINYSHLLERYLRGDDINNSLDHVELSYFMCTKCGEKYIIDWTKNHFPVPFISFKRRRVNDD